MMDALRGLGRGAKVFYRKDATTWQQGELLSVSGEGTASIQVGAATLTVAADLVVPANPVLQDGIPDVVQLSHLNEPGILYNLGHRYKLDHIYTWAGPVLIALNPCKALPLYTPEVAAEYKQAARESVTTLSPHIYLVAAAAFRQMLRHQRSQSLVVSGESGAGKTETTKKAMQYFATLAGGTGVEDQVLETNPVLEAFGNAKTLRNHNSSRFGKLIQIHFNGSFHICGATIKTYLLEKSRVAMQLKGERSFHIFYQLVRGVTDEERKAFLLPAKPQDFYFLNQSGCFDIAGVDDAAEFRVVRRALKDIGVDAEAQTSLFRLLSGLLWLGNIEFEESGTGDSTKVRQTPALGHAASLLGWSPEALITALTTRRIVAPGEVVIKLLKVNDAVEARNSLAKAIYSAIFNWIVGRINARLSSGKSTSGLYIAILDIYGFEQFDRNSFEQLCINYANERLQQQFTHHLFKLEQTEYESEGVDWTKVEFIDNQDCVDVFELMPPKGLGMLAVLDSQCKFPRATDSTLHTQLLDALGPRSHFATNPRVPGSFIIKHYAGNVQYDTTGLLDKNKDTLSADLIQLMASSTKTLMAELGATVQEEADRSTKKGQTVISRFGQQLRELVSELDTTGLHFVRCIKPNAQLAPNNLDPIATLHQLRCCGVLEVARVSAAGFPTRYRLEDFASRYSMLLSPEEQEVLHRNYGSAGSRQICMVLLERFGLRVGQFQLGHTKVFFRPGVLGLVEDRWARMQAAVLAVQAGWRMYRCRSAYLQLLRAANTMQALWRCRVAQLAYRELADRHSAALTFQTAWRMHSARARFLRVRRAVITIQTKGYRVWKFNCWLARVMQARDRAELAAEETRVKNKIEADWFSALRNEYSVSMEDVPLALAAWRECCAAGLTSLEGVQEALQAWRKSLEAPSGPQSAGSLQAAPAAEGAAVVPKTAGAPAADHQATAPAGDAAAATVAAAAVVVAAAPVAGEPSSGEAGEGTAAPPAPTAAPAPAPVAQPLARPPVMIMTPAIVTPAVVNRFELAQELAIQVERLNLENVKLQKHLALERSLVARYQHKYEEQCANSMEQSRLLQAYIQKCRTLFGDSQLPPLPKQVAAVTQPVDEDGVPIKDDHLDGAGVTAHPQPHVDVAGLAGAVTAGAAAATSPSGKMPHDPHHHHHHNPALVPVPTANGGALTSPRPSVSKEIQTDEVAANAGPLAAAASAAAAAAAVVAAAPAPVERAPSVDFGIQTDPAPEPVPPPPPPPPPPPLPAVETSHLAVQTDPLPESLPPPPPPPPVTSAAETQTPIGPHLVSIATETDPMLLPPADRASAAGSVAGSVVAGAALAAAAAAPVYGGALPPDGSDVTTPVATARGVSAFANPAAAEPVAGAFHSPTQSMGSEPVSVDPPSSVGMTTPSVGGTTAGGDVRVAGNGTAGGGAGPANASQRYVAKLGEEFERVMQVLPDDVAFIREVHEGQVVAPEMDPGMELFKLKKKFDVWKREFKEKLRTTEEVLRKIEYMEGRSGGGAPHHHPSQYHAGGPQQQQGDPLRPSQSVRVAGPLGSVGPGSTGPAGRYPPGQATVGASVHPQQVALQQAAAARMGVDPGYRGGSAGSGTGAGDGATPSSAARRKAAGSSKLLNKLFSGNNNPR